MPNHGPCPIALPSLPISRASCRMSPIATPTPGTDRTRSSVEAGIVSVPPTLSVLKADGALTTASVPL